MRDGWKSETDRQPTLFSEEIRYTSSSLLTSCVNQQMIMTQIIRVDDQKKGYSCLCSCKSGPRQSVGGRGSWTGVALRREVEARRGLQSRRRRP